VKSLYPQADGVVLAAVRDRWELRSITRGEQQLWHSSREVDMVTVGLSHLLPVLPTPLLSLRTIPPVGGVRIVWSEE
jgi:hypothetical protein